MKNSDLLWTRLEDNPTDITLKMALADALTEEGEYVEAETIRWCIESGRWDRGTRTTTLLDRSLAYGKII